MVDNQTVVVPGFVIPKLRMLAMHYEGIVTGVVLDDVVQRLIEEDWKRVFQPPVVPEEICALKEQAKGFEERKKNRKPGLHLTYWPQRKVTSVLFRPQQRMQGGTPLRFSHEPVP